MRLYNRCLVGSISILWVSLPRCIVTGKCNWSQCEDSERIFRKILYWRTCIFRERYGEIGHKGIAGSGAVWTEKSGDCSDATWRTNAGISKCSTCARVTLSVWDNLEKFKKMRWEFYLLDPFFHCNHNLDHWLHFLILL